MNKWLYHGHCVEVRTREQAWSKYATSLPCKGLSERESKLYTNFEFCEGKKSQTCAKHIDLQIQEIYVNNFLSFYSSRRFYIFEKTVQVVCN